MNHHQQNRQTSQFLETQRQTWDSYSSIFTAFNVKCERWWGQHWKPSS